MRGTRLKDWICGPHFERDDYYRFVLRKRKPESSVQLCDSCNIVHIFAGQTYLAQWNNNKWRGIHNLRLPGDVILGNCNDGKYVEILGRRRCGEEDVKNGRL